MRQLTQTLRTLFCCFFFTVQCPLLMVRGFSQSPPIRLMSARNNMAFRRPDLTIAHKPSRYAITNGLKRSSYTAARMSLLPPPSSLLFADGSLSLVPSSLAADWMTLEQANALATPFFVLTIFPNAAFVYRLKSLVSSNQCPRGVFVGYLILLFFGLLAGPAEALTQNLYHGASFFDCDWIHGSVSGVFVTAYLTVNMSFLDALQKTKKDEEDDEEPSSSASSKDDEFPAVTFGSFGILLLSSFFASQLVGGVMPPVHSPFAFGNILPVLDTTDAVLMEPPNALSTNCWLNHVLELSQSQVSIRLALEWAKRTQSQGWALVAQSSLLLQFASIAIDTFHLFYNEIFILLPIFGFFLLVGSTAVALAVQQIKEDDDESTTSVDVKNKNRLLRQVEGQEAVVPGGNATTTTTELSLDQPSTYFAKSIALALVIALGVKTFSQQVLASSAIRGDTVAALSMALLFSLVAAVDVCQRSRSINLES